MVRESGRRHDVDRSPAREPVGASEDPLAAMRGCLWGLLAASALWALGGLLAFGLYKRGMLATAALALAALGGAGLVAGTVLALRRLGGSNGQRRQASGPLQAPTDRGHAVAARAVRHSDHS
jgi:hypothetical protein